MEEAIKARIILILSIVILMLLVGNINSCVNVQQQRSGREKEMATRLDLEERMDKFTKEKIILEDKLKTKEKELQEEKDTHQATKKELTQEKLVTQSLKEELERVTKLKEALEEDLKEALVAAKSEQPKK